MSDHRSDRRYFLASAAFSLGTTLLNNRAIGASEADEARFLPFGFSLYGMRSLTLNDAIARCAEIGYDAIELACLPDWPADPARLATGDRTTLRRQVSNQGLTVCSLMENLSPLGTIEQRIGQLKRLNLVCELAADLQPDGQRLVETILGGKPAEWLSIREELVRNLADWAAVAERHQTTIALKPHVASALHTSEAASWLMQRVDSPRLRLAYDYSHFELRGEDLHESLKRLVNQTAFIHVKDTRGTADKFEFLLPGDGRTDYKRYFQRLAESAYRGPIVVEVSGQIHSQSGYDPVAAARYAYQQLSPQLIAAGLRSPSLTSP